MLKFYGFVPDPALTPKQNARAVFAEMPCWYYFCRPSNLSCHNLATRIKPPPNWRYLLGLGLNFCPRARYTNYNLDSMEKRFREDIYKKTAYATGIENDDYDRVLYVRSTRQVSTALVPVGLPSRITQFFGAMRKIFRKKKSPSNLLPCQRACLRALKKSENLVVFPTDKNLGPAITERRRYIKLAFEDHLRDQSTYKALTKIVAIGRMKKIEKEVKKWIKKHKDIIPKNEITFLSRSTKLTDDEGDVLFPHFYVTAKVHKKGPLKTRPIISISGSLLEGIGKWTDRQLQPHGKATDSFVSSSVHLLEMLKEQPPLPPHARIFTCDARSMYTNIDTSHALETLADTLPPHVLEALTIIMKSNVFQFSDRFFIQEDGTAMGSPPACMWATIYFAPHENKLSQKFREWLLLYKRYIDDGLGIWLWTGTPECITAWKAFKAEMQTFGKLRWDFEEPDTTQVFLDLRLTIRNGKIHSTLYEKSMNLYLYLPPHSAHPSGVLKGLVAGMLLRILRLTSDPSTRKAHVQRFFKRLLTRGWPADRIRPIFDKYIQRLNQQHVCQSTNPAISNEPRQNPVFLHINYHPLDPPSSIIQQLFDTHVLRSKSKNPYNRPLAEMKNREGIETGINRLIVCYHRPPNLGNLLSPRKFDSRPGLTVSEHFRSTTTVGPTHPHTHTPTHTHTHTPL
jgi:hypothetical protein